MLDISFSRKLAESGFERRASPASGGGIVYQLADKSGHVCVAKAEWENLLGEFSGKVRRVQRTAKWWFAGLLPGIFVFAMTIGQIVPGAGLLIVLGIFFGPPAIYLWQSYQIRWAAEAVERKLTLRNRVAGPPLKPFQAPRWLEIVFFVFVGPHLALEMVGSLDPDIYRNTPLLGTELNWLSALSFAILAVILYLRWRGRCWQQADESGRHDLQQSQPVMPKPQGFGRKVDAAARARSTTS